MESTDQKVQAESVSTSDLEEVRRERLTPNFDRMKQNPMKSCDMVAMS